MRLRLREIGRSPADLATAVELPEHYIDDLIAEIEKTGEPRKTLVIRSPIDATLDLLQHQVFLDAIGIRVTTDQPCVAAASTTLSPVPLQDSYDTGSVSFVSAVPPPTSVNTGTAAFDKHLNSADLFNTAVHPKARFVSDKLVFNGDKVVEVPGQFTFDGKEVPYQDGDTLGSALHRAGVKVLSRSLRYHRPRGLFCCTGSCASCRVPCKAAWIPTHSAEQWSTATKTATWPYSSVKVAVMSVPHIVSIVSGMIVPSWGRGVRRPLPDGPQPGFGVYLRSVFRSAR